MGGWFRYSGFWELSGYRGLIEKIDNFKDLADGVEELSMGKWLGTVLESPFSYL